MAKEEEKDWNTAVIEIQPKGVMGFPVIEGEVKEMVLGIRRHINGVGSVIIRFEDGSIV